MAHMSAPPLQFTTNPHPTHQISIRPADLGHCVNLAADDLRELMAALGPSPRGLRSLANKLGWSIGRVRRTCTNNANQIVRMGALVWRRRPSGMTSDYSRKSATCAYREVP